MPAKTHVFIVRTVDQTPKNRSDLIPPRLIRGTLREVEAKLRAEVSIEPCTAEQAHSLAEVEIEEAKE